MTQYSENIHNQLLEQLIHIFETEYPTSSLPKPAHLSLVQSKPSGIRKLKKRAQIFLHKILSKNVYISIRSGYRLIRQYAWVVFSQFERVMTFLRIIQIRVKVLMNVKPLSEQSGFDRGLPVHRYYLEQFLREFQFDIRGHCLEFQEDSYTSRFGQGLVTKLDILHHEEGNAQATIVADLTQPNALESESFDCIICTHVLHVVVRLETFAEELYRILKPGGVLLVAVPHISMCAPEWHELWRFTPEGVFSLLSTKFDSNNISLRSYGNSLTAAGKIRGMVTEDFTGKELGFHDPRFVVEVCARVRKEIKE